MTELTAAGEVDLHDVWRLLAEATTKIDRLYMALALNKNTLPAQVVTPTTQRVMEHPFFGMTKSATESVAETMAHLRGERYAL